MKMYESASSMMPRQIIVVTSTSFHANLPYMLIQRQTWARQGWHDDGDEWRAAIPPDPA